MHMILEEGMKSEITGVWEENRILTISKFEGFFYDVE